MGRCVKCERQAVGKSRYCFEHRAESRVAFREKLEAERLERVEYEERFRVLWERAVGAACRAYEEVVPVPMVVEQRADVLDDGSPIVKRWYVEEGVCGFGVVRVKPATSRFGKWVVREGLGKVDDYRGGLRVYPPVPFTQSYVRNAAAARAMAEVLGEGLPKIEERVKWVVYDESRLD